MFLTSLSPRRKGGQEHTTGGRREERGLGWEDNY